MAVKNMNALHVQGETSEMKWEFSESLSGAGNGSTVIIPRGLNIGVMVTVIPGGGATAKAQLTTDSIEDVQVEAATVTWSDWDLGAVSSTMSDIGAPATAFRLVQVGTGTATIKAVAQ